MTVAASTAAYIGIAASAASAGIGAIGAQQSAAATSSAMNYQAQVARNNALIAQQQAQAETAAGDITAQNRLVQAGQQTAAVRAAAGASGLDPNEGSPVRLQSDTEKLGMLDALTIRNNAARRAYGYQAAATGETAQAGLYGAAAQNAQNAGIINSFGSVLAGVSNVSAKWSQYADRFGNNSGIPPVNEALLSNRYNPLGPLSGSSGPLLT